MDQAPLVSDIEIEGQVVLALSRAKIPITAVDWTWLPELGESHLFVVTTLVDTRGPRETYAQILEVLSGAGLYQLVPIRRLFVKSPQDPAAQKLVEELKSTSEGAIHVVRNRTRNAEPQYSVVFAPYVGSGGPIPSKHLSGNPDLRDFLEKRIGIHQHDVKQALDELAQRDSATIFNVQLTLRRAKRLNLAA